MKKFLPLGALLVISIIAFNAPNFIAFNFESRIRFNRNFSPETNEAVINLINQSIRIIYRKTSTEDVILDSLFTERFRAVNMPLEHHGLLRDFGVFIRVDRNYMETMWVEQARETSRLVVHVRILETLNPFSITRLEFAIIQDETGEYRIDSIGLDR